MPTPATLTTVVHTPDLDLLEWVLILAPRTHMSPLRPLLGLLGCPCPSVPTPAEFPGSKTPQGIAALSQSAAFQMLGPGLVQGHTARTRTRAAWYPLAKLSCCVSQRHRLAPKDMMPFVQPGPSKRNQRGIRAGSPGALIPKQTLY